MEQQDLALLERLVAENDELAQLWKQHQELETALEGFNHRVYLSSEEQLERKRLQKIKLAGRDRIEAILAEHRRQNGQDR
ncbi:conserved hypothetical protein [Desulfarculus baarsii DSM 2075]|uniref:DUF465 domain-containing protein n=1 Tax=Desulfarculus baarsii (strain ATCC 33931 / DSM 2075 / LMG 7858 / VKM B-1802 / 2st14) TaxID=644282 RepID=E1QEY6_DESB2|nr:DUF465 domain-containing protein [Desulfarculus baarsii]ADK84122.1 conserved hypothetical protein [Desulfarculus baarsii DSM 2075]